MSKETEKVSKIGGQAVIEGVMMRGTNSIALCVRDENGNLRTSVKRPKKQSPLALKIKKIPLLRGVWAFGASLSLGVPTLMDSAEVFGEEEEPSKFEKYLAKKFKIDLMTVVTYFAVVLGVGLAVLLFFIAPSLLSGLVANIFDLSLYARGWIEGGARLLIFIAYIGLTSLVSDVKRVYMYHGAEHKTINCFESDLELTVENAKKCTCYHNRCGTSFMFFVILLSILVSSAIQVENEFLRILTRIAFLPLLAGAAYELIMFLAKYPTKLLYPLRVPGILMQKITTSEPTDEMLEVAITSFLECQRFDADETLKPYDNLTFKYYEQVKDKYIEKLEKIGGEACEFDWMVCHVLKIGRGEIRERTKITKSQIAKIDGFIKKREKHIPLDYILGVSSFFGRDFFVNSNVLIPRPETELLCEKVISLSPQGGKILDIGTGSGAIAVTCALGGDFVVSASDISEPALQVAKKNAEKHSAKIDFILSDVFENIQGRFDTIVSNPPYIAQSEKETLSKEVLSEPHSALFAEEDGLAIYRQIAENAKNHLEEGGLLLFEIGYTQGNAICEILRKNGFEAEIHKDYSGNDRMVVAKYIGE